MSKKDQAQAIFHSMRAAGQSRKEIIAAFAEKCSISTACASTYYSNFNGGVWSGEEKRVVKSVTVPKIDLTKLSMKELVDLHNEHAVIMVTSFPSREAALKKVEFELKQTAELC